MALFLENDIETLYLGNEEIEEVYLGNELIWSANTGLPVGTTFDFDYTGTVQSVELPKGKYKLQCWGAQGGTSYGSSSATGSKGGYSEGILTLDETKTLYVFVGGKGSRGSSSSLVNGGWNGGGASVGKASYSGEYSYPACGGGATDIALVSSTMSYSSGRTNRSSESLLSRFIVAGGGAGGSYGYYEYGSTSYEYEDIDSVSGNMIYLSGDINSNWSYYATLNVSLEVGTTYRSVISYTNNYSSSDAIFRASGFYDLNGGNRITSSSTYTYTSSSPESMYIGLYFKGNPGLTIPYSIKLQKRITVSSSSYDTSYSNQSQQGGGTSGRGQYPGTQNAAGAGRINGEFGYGGSQTITNYSHCAGGGGGGWYGGGTSYADSSISYINYSGGGSGFVNTSANSSYRPSGYTGLQLDSGTTTAGNSPFPSTSGFNETGHSGNGFARIIAVDENGSYPMPEPTSSVSWEIQSGNWNSASYGSAADGQKWTCVSPGTSGSTVIRCTFSGITSITFNCVYSGESNFDYLTVGKLDTSCTRSSYGTSLQGTSGTAKDITYSCDGGTHFVEFCYSKDGSVDTSPDNATVYVKSYS